MTTYSDADVKEPVTGTDKRIDTLGFGDELTKQYLKDLRSTVKVKMINFGYACLTGAQFEGKLAGSTKRTVDVAKFYKLFKNGGMSEKDFLASISVSATDAEKVLHPKVLDKITNCEPGTPSLTVVRKKGVEIRLVDALEGLRNDVGLP